MHCLGHMHSKKVGEGGWDWLNLFSAKLSLRSLQVGGDEDGATLSSPEFLH